MRKSVAGFLLLLLFSPFTSADDGMINLRSAHDVSTTADRLENILKTKGMKVFTRINHTEGASSVGKTLRPTELLVFGNPRVGTPLMQCSQSVAIDLPQKALIWEDEYGQTWLSYNDPSYLANRHDIHNCDEVLEKIRGALGKFSGAATAE